jgi:hypothetical protein
MLAELASMEGRPSSSSGSPFAVIDLRVDHSNSAGQYQTPSLYIDKKVTWEISRGAIPNDAQKIAGWEDAGLGKLSWSISHSVDIANRAAQLISDYITHRR